MGNHKLVEAAKEALAIAKGDQPAAAIWHNGHQYVPEAELASLRQQLAEARETARREALEEAAKIVHDARADLERQANTTLNSVTHDALLMASDALELVGEEIRALSHPDREGERG